MYIYLDKQGIVKEIINDEALRQSASNVNEIYVYYDGLQEADIGSVLATYGLPDGTITDEMEVATQTQESEIPYNAERDLKYFQYYKAYVFYHFAIADLALSQEGVVRLMLRLAQKDGEYIKVAGLICFDVEGELVKEDHGISVAQYNYLVKAWYDTKECLPLDGSKAMQGNLDMGAHNVLLNGKALKDKNGALNYNGKDLAKREDVAPLQSDVSTLKSDNTKNKADIVSLKSDNVTNKADISALKSDNAQNKEKIVGLQTQVDTINATQNVVDIVGTKAELNAYETKDLHANDKIEVLTDESQNNANTIYEWNGNAWSLVGSKAPYYSKAESDARYNELKAKSYDKDTTEYVTGHVPDSALVKGISVDVKAQKQMLDTIGDEVIKSVKTDTDASLKSLTLPSAKDLKTKDGTSIGGSGDDIFKIALARFINDDWATILTPEEATKFKKAIIVILLDEGNPVIVATKQEKATKAVSDDLSTNASNVTSYSSVLFDLKEDNNLLKFIQNDYTITQDLSSYATKTDLNAKQSTLYHHTITLHNATNTAYFAFTIDRTWQAEITKETLFNTLNGYIVAGSGIVQNMLIDKISFHNTAEKTKVHQYASFGTMGYINAKVTFVSVFGTDYTLEDLVQNP